METLRVSRARNEVFQTLNENKFNPRILYPENISFKNDGAIKLSQYT
jgi:hypothetical protein